MRTFVFVSLIAFLFACNSNKTGITGDTDKFVGTWYDVKTERHVEDVSTRGYTSINTEDTIIISKKSEGVYSLQIKNLNVYTSQLRELSIPTTVTNGGYIRKFSPFLEGHLQNGAISFTGNYKTGWFQFSLHIVVQCIQGSTEHFMLKVEESESQGNVTDIYDRFSTELQKL